MRISTLTVPKTITRGNELIIITRDEYERLLNTKRKKEFHPTVTQKKALLEGRKNRKRGNFLTFDELKQKLGFAS